MFVMMYRRSMLQVVSADNKMMLLKSLTCLAISGLYTLRRTLKPIHFPWMLQGPTVILYKARTGPHRGRVSGPH
jgi:hypothetical protein